MAQVNHLVSMSLIVVLALGLFFAYIAEACKYNEDCASDKPCCCSRFVGSTTICGKKDDCNGLYSCHPKPACEYDHDCASSGGCCCTESVGDPKAECRAGNNECPGGKTCTPKVCTTNADCGTYKCCEVAKDCAKRCMKECSAPPTNNNCPTTGCGSGKCCCSGGGIISCGSTTSGSSSGCTIKLSVVEIVGICITVGRNQTIHHHDDDNNNEFDKAFNHDSLSF